MTEANHVIASPVLIEELTATLIIDFLKGWLTGNFRSTGILTNLVEEVFGTTLSETCKSLCLHEQNISKAEEREVVRLVTAIVVVLWYDEPFDGVASLLDRGVGVTNINGVVLLGKCDVLREMYLLTFIHERLCCWTERLRIAVVNITTQDAEITDITLEAEQFGKFRRYHHVAAKRLCEGIS